MTPHSGCLRMTVLIDMTIWSRIFVMFVCYVYYKHPTNIQENFLCSLVGFTLLHTTSSWSVSNSRNLLYITSTCHTLLRRTANDRRLVGVAFLRVKRVLLLRPVATSCRSTQGDMSVFASTDVWSPPTLSALAFARGQLLESGDRSAFWSTWAFLRRHLPTVAAGGTQSTCGYLYTTWTLLWVTASYGWLPVD